MASGMEGLQEAGLSPMVRWCMVIVGTRIFSNNFLDTVIVHLTDHLQSVNSQPMSPTHHLPGTLSTVSHHRQAAVTSPGDIFASPHGHASPETC